MKYHTLIVEDRKDILTEVCDRVESLGHSFDTAVCQSKARKHLKSGKGYAYILLDLEIPTSADGVPRISNGLTLLREINKIPGLDDVPIIVMTSHAEGNPDLPIETMRHAGAFDFIRKPFVDTGRTLEKTILETLDKSSRSKPGMKSHSRAMSPAEKPQPFEEGEMVFSPTRVEFCGVKICESTGIFRTILEYLSCKTSFGQYKGYSGIELAKLTGKELQGQCSISSTVSNLRDHIERLLLNERNLTTERFDVIDSRGRGYRFTERVIVKHVDKEPLDDTQFEYLEENEEDISETQQWILHRLHRAGEFRKAEYDLQFPQANSTALREDVKHLRQRGYRIVFDGPARTGCYKLR